MTTKSHNAKKPKLAGHPAGRPGDPASSGMAGPGAPEGDPSAPGKHKMSFAQHQHGQAEHAPGPVAIPEPPVRHLKADAQQHQQKSHTHK